MVYALFKSIKCIVLDVDGVLTNGQVLVNEQGDFLRSFNVKDGYVIQKAIKSGLRIAVITGGRSEGVVKRLQALGIEDIHIGVVDKLPVLKMLIERYGVVNNEVAYIGDDIPDLSCMQFVGLALCPKDAVEEVRAVSHYISHKNGGDGSVRDIIEKILKLQGYWNNINEVTSS